MYISLSTIAIIALIVYLFWVINHEGKRKSKLPKAHLSKEIAPYYDTLYNILFPYSGCEFAQKLAYHAIRQLKDDAIRCKAEKEKPSNISDYQYYRDLLKYSNESYPQKNWAYLFCLYNIRGAYSSVFVSDEERQAFSGFFDLLKKKYDIILEENDEQFCPKSFIDVMDCHEYRN